MAFNDVRRQQREAGNPRAAIHDQGSDTKAEALANQVLDRLRSLIMDKRSGLTTPESREKFEWLLVNGLRDLIGGD